MKIPFFTRQTAVEQKSISDPDTWLFDLLGAGGPTNAGVSVSGESALKVPAVASAVRTISEAAACLDVSVVEIADDGTETKIEDHPAAYLLKHDANDWTSGFELIRQLTVDALIRDRGGVAYVNWTGDQPAEIIRYRPGVIDVDLTQDTGEPIYRLSGRSVSAQNVVHVRSTFDRCPVSLAREAIGAALVMEKHASRLFANGARPSGVITTDKQIGDDGVKKMMAGWKPMALSLSDLKAHCNVSGVDDDAVLTRYLAAAQSHVERLLGYRFDTFSEDSPPEDVPADLELAVLMLAADWYENREASIVGVSAMAIPFGVSAIVNEYRNWWGFHG